MFKYRRFILRVVQNVLIHSVTKTTELRTLQQVSHTTAMTG
jgi:hypothetical protein